jgi:hypothetical protein
MIDESLLWKEMQIALADATPKSSGAAEGVSELNCLARFNDAVCRQLTRLWSREKLAQWQVLGGSETPLTACDGKCSSETCRTRSYKLRLFLVHVVRDQERAAVERMITRSVNSPHLYLSRDAIDLARMARLLPPGNKYRADTCAIHACVDELCLLHPDARSATVQIYNRMHTEELRSPTLQTTVYFCTQHERFHLCDQFCDQTHLGRNGELICALSQMVKTAPESVFSYGDGTARITDADVSGGVGYASGTGMSSAITHEDLQETRQFAGSDGATLATTSLPKPRRGYGESDVLRDRGTLVGRRKGRGHGSVIGGEVRAKRDRATLASVTAQSSGDDHALPPQELAKQFDEAARSVANVPMSDVMSQKEGSARQRKLRRAKRVKATLGGAVAHTTLVVPVSFYRLLASDDHDGSAEERLVLSAQQQPRSAGTGGCDDEDGLVILTLNIRATVPFGERSERYDAEFLRDIMEEKRAAVARRARFEHRNIGESIARYVPFGTGRLFVRYGERACAIFWRLFASQQRSAIERNKDAAAEEKLRIAVETYTNDCKRAKKPVVAEDYSRLAQSMRESAIIFKRLVIDETLWTLVETHAALLATEFYFNMIGFIEQFSDRFASEIVDAVQTHFCFEHFVPVILFFMRNGLETNGVVLLPPEHIITHEWFPETATLRLLGLPEQTMTHLCSTVRAYVATAREIKVSMRRLEATQLQQEEIMALRLPSADSPPIENSHAFAEHAAAQLVRLFVSHRSARLELLNH